MIKKIKGDKMRILISVLNSLFFVILILGMLSIMTVLVLTQHYWFALLVAILAACTKDNGPGNSSTEAKTQKTHNDRLTKAVKSLKKKPHKINQASDFPTFSEIKKDLIQKQSETQWKETVRLSKIYFIGDHRVTDNDPTKTNTGQTFLGDEVIIFDTDTKHWVKVFGGIQP